MTNQDDPQNLNESVNDGSSLHSHRVIACLNREQVDYIDKIGKDALFSSGSKLSRTQILAAMVNALKRLNLTGEGVSNVKQFEQRIVDAMMDSQHKANKNGQKSSKDKD